MKRCDQTLLAVTLFLFIAVSPASAFYNPAAGRWLNRDPIGEGGGLNLLAFVRQAPVSFVDPNGLTLIDGGTFQAPIEFIRNLDFEQPSTAFGLTITSLPKLRGEDNIVEPFGHCYQCAEVKEVQQFDVVLTTYFPDHSAIGTAITIGGMGAILAHENKHRKISTDGYNQYLDPANNGRSKQCGMVCRRKTGEAAALLADYIENVRKVAEDAYLSYILAEHRFLDNFETPKTNWDWDPSGTLFNGIKERWNPNSPWINPRWPTCPVSDFNP